MATKLVITKYLCDICDHRHDYLLEAEDCEKMGLPKDPNYQMGDVVYPFSRRNPRQILAKKVFPDKKRGMHIWKYLVANRKGDKEIWLSEARLDKGFMSCEICHMTYKRIDKAQRCAAKGMPRFKFAVGDLVLYLGLPYFVTQLKPSIEEHKPLYTIEYSDGTSHFSIEESELTFQPNLKKP